MYQITIHMGKWRYSINSAGYSLKSFKLIFHPRDTLKLILREIYFYTFYTLNIKGLKYRVKSTKFRLEYLNKETQGTLRALSFPRDGHGLVLLVIIVNI